MKALYFDKLPLDAEHQKSQSPEQFTIMGGNLYYSEAFIALLKYSTYDQILVPFNPRPATGDVRDSALFIQNQTRIQLISEQDLMGYQKIDQLVFMTQDMDLVGMSRLRRISGIKTAPIMGLIHSINYSRRLRGILVLLLANLGKQDALTCSSSAGKKAIENYIELICERFDKQGISLSKPLFQMPIIPLGVDTHSFNIPPDADLRQKLGISDGPIILYLGRLSATSKGDLIPLIIAFGRILEATPHATLIIAGDDTQHHMSQNLEDIGAHISPSHKIKIIANPDASLKKQLYRISDIFVSPSDSLQETFGLTVVEAMAAGLPTIVSDWDGYKDLVVEGQTGFKLRTKLPDYSPLFDSLRGSGEMLYSDILAATTMIDWQQFIEYISLLISNPELRHQMGQAAMQRARMRFDWAVVISAYEELWNDLSLEAHRQNNDPKRISLELDSFGYKEIFSHYSSGLLSEETLVGLPAVGQQKLSTSVLRVTEPWFRENIFASIMDLFGETKQLSVHQIIHFLTGKDELQDVTHLAHLCRLLKYGFLMEVNRR